MTIAREILRFSLVGIVSNVLLYLLYIGLTTSGMGHKTAMSFAYAIGIVQTFIFNRNWTFDDSNPYGSSFRRYVVVYFIGYVLQWSLLAIFVDCLHLPHAAVQAVSIVVVAAFVFVMQKRWVFQAPAVKPSFGAP